MNRKIMLLMAVIAAITIPSVAMAEVVVSTSASVTTSSTATSVVTITTAENYPQANAAGYLTLATSTSGVSEIELNALASGGTIYMANVLELLPTASGTVQLSVNIPTGVTMVLSTTTQSIVATSSGFAIADATGAVTGSISSSGVLTGALDIVGTGSAQSVSSFTVTAATPVMVGFVLDSGIGAGTGAIGVGYTS